MSSALLVFICSTLLFYFIQTKFKLLRVGCRIAGPWALPLVGNVQMISKLKPEYLFLAFTENRAKYRESYRLWLGPQLWVFLHSPAETRDALNDSTLRKAETFNQLKGLIGNGLLLSHGKHWDLHRRILGPAFHPNILNGFTQAISKHADQLVLKLEKITAQTVEVSEYLFPCILDTIIDTSMGKNIDSQSDPDCRYTHAFHKTSELLFKRMVNPLLGFDFIFKRTDMCRQLDESIAIIHELMEEVIAERLIYLSGHFDWSNAKKRRTFLDTLLTTKIEGKPLLFQDVRDEVKTFVFAGVDTTTAAMAFILYALAKYPAEQAKLFDEIHSNSPTLSSDDDSFTTSEIKSLGYLDMFIKECLRYYTIVPMTGRQTTSETTIGNRRYCAGVTLWINMYGLAHDEQFFAAPYEFRPQRFSREEQAQLPPFSYIPFSGGPHVCIGRRYALLILKILTVKILQKFEIHLGNPHEELVLMAQMVLKSQNGINLIFKPRN